MTTQAECVHHYVLGDPADRQVVGVCKHCSAEKTWPVRDDAISFNASPGHDPLLARVTSMFGLSGYR